MPGEGSTLSHTGKHSPPTAGHACGLVCVSAGVTEASLPLPEALLGTPAPAALTGGCWGHNLGSPLLRNDSLAPSLQWELWPEGWLKTQECLTPRCILEQEKKSNLKTFCFLKLGWFCASYVCFLVMVVGWADQKTCQGWKGCSTNNP